MGLRRMTIDNQGVTSTLTGKGVSVFDLRDQDRGNIDCGRTLGCQRVLRRPKIAKPYA
jgi:hypothetical protein